MCDGGGAKSVGLDQVRTGGCSAFPHPQHLRGIAGKIAGAALVRVATRSVPGAILVTGGLIAKAVHDKRKAKRVAKAAAKDLAE